MCFAFFFFTIRLWKIIKHLSTHNPCHLVNNMNTMKVCSQFSITFFSLVSPVICSAWLFQSTFLLCLFTLFKYHLFVLLAVSLEGQGVFRRAFNIQKLKALELLFSWKMIKHCTLAFFRSLSKSTPVPIS